MALLTGNTASLIATRRAKKLKCSIPPAFVHALSFPSDFAFPLAISHTQVEKARWREEGEVEQRTHWKPLLTSITGTVD